MSNTSSKVVWITVCLFIGIYSASKLWKSNGSSATKIDEIQISKVDRVEYIQKESVKTKALSSDKSISPADVADLKALSEERGYIPGEDRVIYQSYDFQTLEDLADGGDIRALDALAKRSTAAGKFSEAEGYYWRAAIAGSTTAVGHLALLAEPSSIIEMREEERREKLIETMSLLKLAEIRGDIQSATVIARGVKSNYESRFGVLNFSEEESTRINKKAKQLYDDLKSHRSERGLKDFDNSAPVPFNEMYKSK